MPTVTAAGAKVIAMIAPDSTAARWWPCRFPEGFSRGGLVLPDDMAEVLGEKILKCAVCDA